MQVLQFLLCAGANALTPAAMAEANPSPVWWCCLVNSNGTGSSGSYRYRNPVPLITGYVAEHFAKKDNTSEKVVEAA